MLGPRVGERLPRGNRLSRATVPRQEGVCANTCARFPEVLSKMHVKGHVLAAAPLAFTLNSRWPARGRFGWRETDVQPGNTHTLIRKKLDRKKLLIRMTA